MNICYIVTKSEMGGAQKWVYEQTQIIPDSWNVCIITNKPGWLNQVVSSNDVLFVPHIERKFSLSTLFSIVKFCKNHKIDLLVSSSANAGLYSRLLTFFVRINVVYVSHGWSAIYNGGVFTCVYIFIERYLAKLSKGILCISLRDEQIAKDVIKIPNDRIKCIPNKVIEMPMKLDSDRSLCDVFSLLAVARFAHPKRMDLLIDAMQLVPDVRLTVIGYGDSETDLKDRAGSNVVFLGRVDGFDRYSDYDAFVLISESEGLPMTGLEAMSVGLPLVLSNVGGCSELIKYNGVLVENNITSIVKGIKDVVKNCNTYALNSISLYKEKYSLIEGGAEYVEYYKKIIIQ